MATAFFFRGIQFPFQSGNTSFPAAATDDDLIKQSLIQIVLTQKGERIMRPDFGTRALSFIFENNDDTLAEAIRTDLATAVAKYEPRVLLKKIEITREDSQVVVDIRYVVVASRRDQRLKIDVPSNAPTSG
jgi:phage baseplate assembly protein W